MPYIPTEPFPMSQSVICEYPGLGITLGQVIDLRALADKSFAERFGDLP